jgi:hypothetical protein
MAETTKPTIFQFRAKLNTGLWRDVEIEGADTLEGLAEVVLAAYNFDCDNCYGFYSNLNAYTNSGETYELFKDLGQSSGAKNVKGVTNTLISKVFSLKKRMLFLFDYGDDWEFILTCTGIVKPESFVTYPRSTGGKGDAPEQYPAYEE